MSIFTSTLAYESESLKVISKVSFIAGSLVASIIGFAYLNNFKSTFDLKIKLEHPPRTTKTFSFTPGIKTAGA